MFISIPVYSIYIIYASDVKSEHTQMYIEGIGKVWNEYESYDCIKIET